MQLHEFFEEKPEITEKQNLEDFLKYAFGSLHLCQHFLVLSYVFT